MNGTARDSVGRIPFSESIFTKNRISPRRPYASLIMAWMENALVNGKRKEALMKAPSPVPDVEHIVVSCHDIDFYHTGAVSTLIRLVKNLVISFRLYRSGSFFRSNIHMIFQLALGKRVGDYLPPLIERSRSLAVRSSIFAVSSPSHRRDPNYRLEQLSPRLREAAAQGFPIAVHACYDTIQGRAGLAAQAAALERAIGARPLGSRQHWLRFDQPEKLFQAVERSGLLFDSSLGFAETVGFRNGASFAYPPYNFSQEMPHQFLEIPLVLMDGNLEAACRASGEDPESVAREILSASRKWAWGGIAAVWHNPIEPIQVPPQINRVFWTCVTKQRQYQEQWISATDFLNQCLSRYQNAGLLQDVRIDA